MKKSFLLALLISTMLVSSVFAVNVRNTEIMNTDFNAVTTSDTSSEIDIIGYERTSFYVTYNETQVGNAISAAIKPQISSDGTNWLDSSFYDFAGGSTLQTSETISADGDYYFWMGTDVIFPYIRVSVTATNTDADDLLTVTVDIFAKE